MIYFLGDVHSHFSHIDNAIAGAKVKPSACIFLGDIEAPIPFERCIENIIRQGIQVHWIRGNHDSDTEENWQNLSGLEAMTRNIDGKIITIEGIRIAGLGGVFRGEVWHPGIDNGQPSHANYAEYEKWIRSSRNLKQRITRKDLAQMQAVPSEQRHWNASLLDASRLGKLLKHRTTIWPDTFERLADQRADILVTHEAPSCHPHGFAPIALLAQVMGVRASFHGHQHDCLDYSRQFDALGFRAYGVGFCGITSYDPVTRLVENVAPGDFDQARLYRQAHVVERS